GPPPHDFNIALENVQRGDVDDEPPRSSTYSTADLLQQPARHVYVVSEIPDEVTAPHVVDAFHAAVPIEEVVAERTRHPFPVVCSCILREPDGQIRLPCVRPFEEQLDQVFKVAVAIPDPPVGTV